VFIWYCDFINKKYDFKLNRKKLLFGSAFLKQFRL